MPQFMGHSVFPHVLQLLGTYDAESLFAPEQLEIAKQDLVEAMQSGASGSWGLADFSA